MGEGANSFSSKLSITITKDHVFFSLYAFDHDQDF